MTTSDHKPRILLAEDEEDVAFLIRFLLERQGFVVEHAPDGRQAIELLSDTPGRFGAARHHAALP
ncbi:hypothetical protein [Halomonas sp. E19]|uniref:hypothetical protein n=1 Tax=Halomonas sp. E19 TaxID=3397247 RepID=UPI004033A3D5